MMNPGYDEENLNLSKNDTDFITISSGLDN